MKKLIIGIHSVTDIITNSSTEMFCNVKGKSEDAVQEILDKITDDIGCSCVELDVDQAYFYNEETGEETEPEGIFSISYEQSSEPCKLILDKIKEVFKIIIIKEK